MVRLPFLLLTVLRLNYALTYIFNPHLVFLDKLFSPHLHHRVDIDHHMPLYTPLFSPLHRRSSRIAVKCYWLVLNSAVERIIGLQHVEDFSLPRCDALPPDLRQQGILEVPVFDILIKDGGSDICNLVLISPFDISSKPYRHCFNLIVFPYPYCPQMTFSVSTIASLPPAPASL